MLAAGRDEITPVSKAQADPSPGIGSATRHPAAATRVVTQPAAAAVNRCTATVGSAQTSGHTERLGFPRGARPAPGPAEKHIAYLVSRIDGTVR